MLTEILRRHRYVPAEPAERQSRGHKRQARTQNEHSRQSCVIGRQTATAKKTNISSTANAPPIFCRPWMSKAKRKPRFYATYRYAEAVTQIRSTTRIGTACVVHDHDEQYHERRKNDSKDKMNGTTNMTGVSTKGTLTGVTTKGTVTDQHNERHGTMNCG